LHGKKVYKMEHLAEIVKERRAAGETNRKIAESYGVIKKQIKQLVNRQNRKERLLTAGYIPQWLFPVNCRGQAFKRCLHAPVVCNSPNNQFILA